MKVLVTGASGFIGKYCVEQLKANGHEVHAVSLRQPVSTSGVTWHHVNLLTEGEPLALMRRVKPTHLLHLAGCTAHGEYWTSLENTDWVQASMAMIKAFTASGGSRIVSAGTCAEYAMTSGVCDEVKTPLRPATNYGRSKQTLQELVSDWSQQSGFSSAWGRIFSLYGPYEHPKRLVAGVINHLIRGDFAICNNPELVRDYLHVKDVASAFVHLLECDTQGPVNICSGQGVTLGEIVTLIAEKFDALSRIRMGSLGRASGRSPLILVGKASRINLSGWKPQLDLSTGIEETIVWWRRQLCQPAIKD
jgi:nucleoside-diphosphate-sugar epimerase